MLSKRDYSARLWALGALRMLCHKTHLVADRELVEPAIHDAVAVEIDLVAVGGEDKAAILFREEAPDFSVVGNHMQLDVSARLASVVFKQSAGRVKSVADRDVDILVGMVRCRIPTYRDFAAGDVKIDANPEQIALKAARVLTFNDDAA